MRNSFAAQKYWNGGCANNYENDNYYEESSFEIGLTWVMAGALTTTLTIEQNFY